MSSQIPLRASDLSLALGGQRIIDDMTLSADTGQVTALLGPNGAGKTSFIRCCTALLPPTAGKIELFGQPPGSAAALAQVGLMPQHTGAWSGITARGLLHYLARLYTNPQPVASLMERLGIEDFADRSYRQLSGGQQQLVNLAGALIGRPSLVFLDEPTAGLDVRAKHSVWELIRQVKAAGVAVLLTSHDMREVAELADQLHIIDRGRITAHGSLAELTAQADLEEVFLANTSGDRP